VLEIDRSYGHFKHFTQSLSKITQPLSIFENAAVLDSFQAQLEKPPGRPATPAGTGAGNKQTTHPRSTRTSVIPHSVEIAICYGTPKHFTQSLGKITQSLSDFKNAPAPLPSSARRQTPAPAPPPAFSSNS
jgi:hypothetical protein